MQQYTKINRDKDVNEDKMQKLTAAKISLFTVGGDKVSFGCWYAKPVAYRKVPKFSDARKPCCNQPKIQIKMPNLRVFHQKDANGKANSKDPDQTAPRGPV